MVFPLWLPVGDGAGLKPMELLWRADMVPYSPLGKQWRKRINCTDGGSRVANVPWRWPSPWQGPGWAQSCFQPVFSYAKCWFPHQKDLLTTLGKEKTQKLISFDITLCQIHFLSSAWCLHAWFLWGHLQQQKNRSRKAEGKQLSSPWNIVVRGLKDDCLKNLLLQICLSRVLCES